MKRKFSKILGVGLTLALLASLLMTAAPVSADVSVARVSLDDNEISATADYTITFDVTAALEAVDLTTTGANSVAVWSTDPATTPVRGDVVHLDTTGTTSPAEARIEIEMPAGTTLGDIDTISWWRYIAVGYAPHVDIKLDLNGDGTYNSAVDDALVIQYAYNTQLHFADAPYYGAVPGGWYQTFDDDGDGPAEITDTTTGWATTGAAGGPSGPSPNWINYTLADWKAGVTYTATGYSQKTIDANSLIYSLEIEVDHWAAPIDAYIDDITINGVPFPSEIAVEFPEDFVLTNASATVGASSGIGTQAFAALPALSAVSTTTTDDDTLTILVPQDIGAGATVQVVISDVVNVDDPDDDYTLWVSTSEETDAVESEEYEIGVPTVGVLPGVVELYNPSGILMNAKTGDEAIQLMLTAAVEGGTIKIGEGHYTTDVDTKEIDVTIEGSGDVEDIIVEGDWTVDVAGITIDGISIDGDIVVTAADFTIEDSIVDDGGTLSIDGIDATIEDTIFNVEDDVGVAVDATGATITKCTFNVEAGGVAISVEAGGTDVAVEDCTFNGGSGVGINVTDVLSGLSVEDSIFDGLDTALDIDDGTVTGTGNTIKNCAAQAIIVTAATATNSIILSGNTITGNDANDILQVADDAGKVHMLFNTITDNVGAEGLLIDNNDLVDDLSVANNWWGDAAGPGSDAFSAGVVSEPFLAGPVSTTAGIDANVTSADFEADVGVTVAVTGDAMDVVAASEYLVNPVAAIDNAVGFWDVYVTGTDLGDIQIRFYTDVTADTEVWVWGEARGEWLKATSVTSNLFSGFILVTVKAASGIPMVDDLAALPFVVIEPPAAAAVLDAPETISPEGGEKDVGLRPAFAWTAIADVLGYEFELADNPNFVAPLMKLSGELGRLIVPYYQYMPQLIYSKAYYWRVRAVDAITESDWVGGVFITIAEPEPEPEEEPVWMCSEGLTFDSRAALEAHLATAEAHQPVEEPDIILEPPDIILQAPDVILPAETPITPGWIYVIIGVGAVLVISMIVLIVRTRRVA